MLIRVNQSLGVFVLVAATRVEAFLIKFGFAALFRPISKQNKNFNT